MIKERAGDGRKVQREGCTEKVPSGMGKREGWPRAGFRGWRPWVLLAR
jgi:hypothetical protein